MTTRSGAAYKTLTMSDVNELVRLLLEDRRARDEELVMVRA